MLGVFNIITTYPYLRTNAIFEKEMQHPFLTSSTAQCGGGSFKDRKPIGEVRLL
jgi:hypothetical protein